MRNIITILMFIVSIQGYAISNDYQARTELNWLLDFREHTADSVERAKREFKRVNNEFYSLQQKLIRFNSELSEIERDMNSSLEAFGEAYHEALYTSNIYTYNSLMNDMINERDNFFYSFSKANNLARFSYNITARMFELVNYGGAVYYYIELAERNTQKMNVRISQLKKYIQSNPNSLTREERQEVRIIDREVKESLKEVKQDKSEIAQLREKFEEQKELVDGVVDRINKKNDLSKGDFNLDF